MAWASVRPSVSLSVCSSHICIVSKRCKLGSPQFTVGCLKLSSFSQYNCVPLGAGVPLERGRQRGVLPKRRYFAIIGSYSVKRVADKYRHAAYHNKHWWQAFLELSTSLTLNDFEPALPPQRWGVIVNFSPFLDAAHISTLNCYRQYGRLP